MPTDCVSYRVPDDPPFPQPLRVYPAVYLYRWKRARAAAHSLPYRCSTRERRPPRQGPPPGGSCRFHPGCPSSDAKRTLRLSIWRPEPTERIVSAIRGEWNPSSRREQKPPCPLLMTPWFSSPRTASVGSARTADLFSRSRMRRSRTRHGRLCASLRRQSLKSRRAVVGAFA